MVKAALKILLAILPVCITVCVTAGCRVDPFGLFASTDLDTRLKEKNNFKFLSSGDLSPMTLGEEYLFIVLTDTHIEKGNTYGLEELKTVIENNKDIKFAVFCGDITQNGKEKDVKKFIDTARSLGIPAYPVIGNHDIYFGNWPVWKDLIGSTSYRVSGDGATLFILDSANGFIGKGQTDWLENELKETRGKVFVFSHHNFFVGRPKGQQLADTKERARIISLLSGKCDIMFTGHSHERLIREAGGVLYLNIEAFTRNRTYCLVSVKKTGVSYEFKNL